MFWEKKIRMEIDIFAHIKISSTSKCEIGNAEKLAKQLGKDGAAIQSEMMAGDYDNLIAVFDREFGDYVDLVQ